MIPNQNYRQLQENYLFSEVARRAAAYRKAHPERELLHMGIGDVTLPLCGAVVDALKQAAEEMGKPETFRGYGPEQGYAFLREAVKGYYAGRGVELDVDEIFISDGAKSDLGNILDLLDRENTVCIPDPVYPVYVDTNLMDGRKIVFAAATEANGFLPLPDDSLAADVIYLCSPNNPTGAVYRRDQLQRWVDYANERRALILFDAAYEAFIQDPELPRSIFEINGARTCAVEFCSLSKTAGFTGTRCGYTVVPEELCFGGMRFQKMWLRRQATKFNGVSYLVQRGAQAVFTPEGQRQVKENLAYYRRNAAVIMQALEELGVWYTGGKNSPYLWLRCPGGKPSWDFFDSLLHTAGIVGTPGSGFGRNGEHYFRLTAFSSRANTEKAMERLKALQAAL